MPKVLNRVAVNVYKGLNTAGRAVKNVANAGLDAIEGKLKDMDHDAMIKNVDQINEHFPGGLPAYLKYQEGEKKKLK